jgi:hypothetical protein
MTEPSDSHDHREPAGDDAAEELVESDLRVY